MAKKDFTGDFSGLLSKPKTTEATAPAPERPQAKNKEPESAPGKRGRGRPKVDLGADESRATVIVTAETMEAIRAIAYWERLLVKEVMTEALVAYVKAYEKKHGAIKPIPPRGKDRLK